MSKDGSFDRNGLYWLIRDITEQQSDFDTVKVVELAEQIANLPVREEYQRC